MRGGTSREPWKGDGRAWKQEDGLELGWERGSL